MRRPTGWKRLCAAMLAGLFLLAGHAGVYGYHACTQHDHGGGEHAHGAPGHAAQAHHDRAHAHHGDVPADHHADHHADHAHHDEAHAHHDGAHSHHDDAPDRPAPCTCIDTCHASAAAPLASDGARTVAVPVAASARSFPAEREFRSHRLAGYFLPFPNGPPSTCLDAA